ncbi:TetR family transcriptional regulator [Camelimonas abortus]|uniref:TetR family transcriptional regulator n=1 Tax=Camelimonas abortus TaxID=1017184 RepID=A0ABV7LAW8_9HYPH
MDGRQEDAAQSARDTIKRAACELFALRGVDGVTVREIVAASGQKNHGALTYYFGSKENLVREIVADGARAINDARNRMLDELERGPQPPTLRQAMRALVLPSFAPAGGPSGRQGSYMRFITLLSLTHRRLFMASLAGDLNSGYLRCLDLLRRLTPGMDDRLRNRRLVFIEASLGAMLSLREGALAGAPPPEHMWRDPLALEDVVMACVAILTAPSPAEADG